MRHSVDSAKPSTIIVLKGYELMSLLALTFGESPLETKYE